VSSGGATHQGRLRPGRAGPGAGIGWAALRRRHRVPVAVLGGWLAVWGMVAVAQAGLMVRSSRAGKLTERDRLLDELPWRGDERVLDVGCGRGLLLIGAANAQAEGVAERIELCDGDARQLPFDDQTFDVVVSSMALHNISRGRGAGRGDRRGRARAQAGRPRRHPRLSQHRVQVAEPGRSQHRRVLPRSQRRFGMYPPVRVVSATRP